jgi:glycosyltransferase involved in cell wall biosynthesis
MTKLSVCYIVKNESLYIEASIKSTLDIAQEILVFDTGSTDSTLDILNRLTREISILKVEKMTWTNHFADARNHAAQLAQNDWIFFVDGDEVLEVKDAQKILTACESNTAESFSVIQRNYTRESTLDDLQPVSLILPGSQAPESLFFFDNLMERILNRKTGLKYEGRVHESLLPLSRKLNLRHQNLDVILHHFGRLKDHQEKKTHFYLELSQLKIEEESNNPVAWVEYAVNLLAANQKDLALKTIVEAVRLFPQVDLVWKTAYQTALRCQLYSLADQWIEKYLEFHPNDSYSLTQRTTALLYQGKWDECQKLSESLLSSEPHNFVCHVNLGVLLFEKKDFVRSKKHIQLALDLRPNDSFLTSALKKFSG